MMKQTWDLKVPNQEYIAEMGGENHLQLENRDINSYERNVICSAVFEIK